MTARPIGRELDLSVQAAGRHAKRRECAEDASASTARLVGVIRAAGMKKPVSRKFSASGNRPVSAKWQIDSLSDDAFDRDVIREGLADARRVISEIRLEHHLGTLRPESSRRRRDKVILVVDEEGVATALRRTWLQDRRPADR